MTMPLLRSDGLEAYYLSENTEPVHNSAGGERRSAQANVPFISGKLRMPEPPEGLVQRRLLELLERSAQNHSGTLLIGRTGTGKTALAASFAATRSDSSWYSLDASDSDWPTFARYFRAAVMKDRFDQDRTGAAKYAAPIDLFAGIAADMDLYSAAWPSLTVLDGAHHLFDSEWFGEFFQMLMASLPQPAHVLVLSRSKPPSPLWRLRSKQVLNVMDEKLLSFSAAESEELFARHGLGKREAAKAHRECFGRAGKLMRILESKRPTVPQNAPRP